MAYSPRPFTTASMHAIRLPRRSFLIAVAVGAAVTAVCHLPHLALAERLNGAFYGWWSRAPTPAPPADMLLVALQQPADLAELAALAATHGSKLLVTTLAEPPRSAAAAAERVLGPIEIPVGGRRLHRTAWMHGGYLWPRADTDGVVRHDWPVLDDALPVPSLGFAAAAKLLALEHPGAETPAPATDGSGRRWLRLYPGRPFPEHRVPELAARPELLRDAVVVAGGTDSSELTPLGRMTSRELLAQVIAEYRQDRAVRAAPAGAWLPWLAAGAVLLVGALMPRRPTVFGRALLPAGAAAGLLGWSIASFALAGLWLPVAGPALLLLGTAAADAWQRPRRHGAGSAEVARARELAASGRLRESWTVYAALPLGPALLPELYALGCAFERQAEPSHAAHVFHRIAQTDPTFRDAARRLVHCGRSGTAAAAPAGADEASAARTFPASLDRYQLLEPIGRGAMGCVYLGRDPRINRIVAIKAVDLAAEFEPAELAEASRTFQLEAQTAGRLSHPNIVTVFDVGEAHGFAYIAMEYAKGRHLSDFAAPETLLPPAKVLELLSRAAEALDYAHAENVVHRDIKPANIMYDAVSDSLKITDFGIARLIGTSRTRTGIVLGTPAFMSPEQVEGKNVNGHTDLFALGVSLYQLLTGRLPFRGASMTNLMFVIANEPHDAVSAVRGDLPEWLDRIVDTALAKDPAQRFQSGAAMAAALREGAAALG